MSCQGCRTTAIRDDGLREIAPFTTSSREEALARRAQYGAMLVELYQRRSRNRSAWRTYTAAMRYCRDRLRVVRRDLQRFPS
jgi:hypothetical protein